MAKELFPNSNQDLTNAHLYVELQKAGLGHNEILAKLVSTTGAYSKDVESHANAVKADQDQFIQNKYSNMSQEHDIGEFQKDMGPIPALKKFKNWFHSIVHTLDDGSFEVLLFKKEDDYDKSQPNQVVQLDPMLEVSASLNEDDFIVASVEEELAQMPYMSLALAMFSLPTGLELNEEELGEYQSVIAYSYSKIYDEMVFTNSNAVEAVHPRDKGKPEKKLHKIKPQDLNDLADIAGTGITKHNIRSAELSGLDPVVVDAVEKSLVAASNRTFQKWVAKRGKESGVQWGKLSESHAEFANYVTSDYISKAADELLSKLVDMDLVKADDYQRAYAVALSFFVKDIVDFIRRSGPAAYKDDVEEWHNTLWGEGLKKEPIEDFGEEYVMKDAA